MTNPVEMAVAPLKSEAVARAEKEATITVNRVREALAANGWDINAAAPYPRRNMGEFDRRNAHRKYNLFHALVEADPAVRATYMPGLPSIVRMVAKKEERFVQNAMEMAAAQYDAFVVKLVGKIGKCDAASLAGSHVWGHSILTVAKGEAVERWKTQQIVNQSVLGTVFNQWPTRKLKR